MCASESGDNPLFPLASYVFLALSDAIQRGRFKLPATFGAHQRRLGTSYFLDEMGKACVLDSVVEYVWDHRR